MTHEPRKTVNTNFIIAIVITAVVSFLGTKAASAIFDSDANQANLQKEFNQQIAAVRTDLVTADNANGNRITILETRYDYIVQQLKQINEKLDKRI